MVNKKTGKAFDKVTQFRLINAFCFALSFNIIMPVILQLKGQIMAAYIISIFMILGTLSVKTNRVVVEKFSIPQLFKIGVFIHFIYLITSSIYFWDKSYFIYIDSTLGIIDIIFFSALSIKLNKYLAVHYPDSVSEFGITRNNQYANGTLSGLLIATITSFYNLELTVICSIIVGFLFTLWMIKNWSYYECNMIGKMKYQ